MPVAIPSWHHVIPLVLEWPTGAVICTSTPIFWSVDAPYEMGASLTSKKTGAALYVSGPGTATVTATVNAVDYVATITVEEQIY